MDSTARTKARMTAMPSPSPSAPSTSDQTSMDTLPTPRLHRLGPGSQKEIAFINYIDSRMLQMNRRYAKKFSADEADGDDEVRGYDTFAQAAADVERVLDAVWVSNTPTLQIPYLLSLAGIISEYLSAFTFSQDTTIRLIDKMDQAFASLLNPDGPVGSGNGGSSSGFYVSITDRVRIRSVVEDTRLIAIDVVSKSGVAHDLQDVTELTSDTDFTGPFQEEGNGEDQIDLNLSISKIYERSLSILGDGLG